MKALVFSDTHFGTVFEEKRFNFLKQLIVQADKIIINGDFWDSYLCSVDVFLASDWRKLLQLLAKKDTWFTIGNHDRNITAIAETIGAEKRVKEKIELQIGKQSYHIMHGHQLSPEFEERHPQITKIGSRYYPSIFDWEESSGLMGKLSRLYFARKRAGIWQDFQSFGPAAKRTEQWLILGHSHLDRENIQKRIASLGAVRLGWASYAWLTKNGSEIHLEKYA